MIRRVLRPWWARWIVLPILALAAAHTGWLLVLKWRFERRLDLLRAAGAPVDLRDLRRSPVPDEDNAAALWREAQAWYQEHLSIPTVVRMNVSEDSWDEDDRAAVSEYLAGDPYVDLLARAAAKPHLWLDPDWEAGPRMEVRVIPQMAVAATYLEHRVRYAQRATSEALRPIALLLDLAPKLERSLVLFVAVRWTVEETAAQSLRDVAAKPGFDAREARTLLDRRFAVADDLEPLRDAFRGERAQGLAILRRWIGGDSPRRIAGDLAESLQELGEWTVEDRIWASWLIRPLAYRDALGFLDLIDGNLRLVDLPARDAWVAAERLGEECRRGTTSLFSRLFGTLGPLAFRKRLRHQAELRIARVGLALLELRQTTGAWPATLDAVVPLVGEEWVEDPFTGGRLQYEPGVRIEAAVPITDEALRADDEIVWRLPPPW